MRSQWNLKKYKIYFLNGNYIFETIKYIIFIVKLNYYIIVNKDNWYVECLSMKHINYMSIICVYQCSN